MTWIKTVPLDEADEKLRQAMKAQRDLYPAEYAAPVHPTPTAAPPASSPRTASFPTRFITPSRPSAC